MALPNQDQPHRVGRLAARFLDRAFFNGVRIKPSQAVEHFLHVAVGTQDRSRLAGDLAEYSGPPLRFVTQSVASSLFLHISESSLRAFR